MKYEYGVEYETNGKKPDLADDVIVEFQHSYKCWMLDKLRISSWDWAVSSAFRIVDERYKPVDVAPARLMKDGENNQVFKADVTEKSWHEKGERPPVGTECEIEHSDGFVHDCIYRGTTKRGLHIIEMTNGSVDFFGSLIKLRPLKTERDKFIEAVTNAVKAKHAAPDSVYKNFAIALYDSGFKAPE